MDFRTVKLNDAHKAHEAVPVAIALGGNLGEPERSLAAALVALREGAALADVRASTLRWTAPVGTVPQPQFLNGAVVATTTWPPQVLLAWLHAIEASLGRERPPATETRWGPRSLDLDLLMYGGLQLTTASLMLPHPELAHRRFVLEPLAELAPDWVVPGTGATVASLLERLS